MSELPQANDRARQSPEISNIKVNTDIPAAPRGAGLPDRRLGNMVPIGSEVGRPESVLPPIVASDTDRQLTPTHARASTEEVDAAIRGALPTDRYLTTEEVIAAVNGRLDELGKRDASESRVGSVLGSMTEDGGVERLRQPGESGEKHVTTWRLVPSEKEAEEEAVSDQPASEATDTAATSDIGASGGDSAKEKEGIWQKSVTRLKGLFFNSSTEERDEAKPSQAKHYLLLETRALNQLVLWKKL